MIENKEVETLRGKRISLSEDVYVRGQYNGQGPGRVLIDAGSATFSTLPLYPTKNHVNASFDTMLRANSYVNLSLDVYAP